MLFWSDTEFIVESVMPNLLHVVPVGDDTVLNGVLQGEDTTLGLRLITEKVNLATKIDGERCGCAPDIGVLLAHSDHDTLVARTTNDGPATNKKKPRGYGAPTYGKTARGASSPKAIY